MILAVDWTAVGIVGTLIVSLLGSLFGLYQARKADRSASTTKTIELGVKDLIDQYQEQNKDLKQEVTDCKMECSMLRTELAVVRIELQEEKGRREDLEAQVIRLKRVTGELP